MTGNLKINGINSITENEVENYDDECTKIENQNPNLIHLPFGCVDFKN